MDIQSKKCKNFNIDYQDIKRKMKLFFKKYLVSMKKGCIFALANENEKSS